VPGNCCASTVLCRYRTASPGVATDDLQAAAAPDRYLPGQCRL
jgi:hypothetical protein